MYSKLLPIMAFCPACIWIPAKICQNASPDIPFKQSSSNVFFVKKSTKQIVDIQKE
jgi:hypothetical protein